MNELWNENKQLLERLETQNNLIKDLQTEIAELRIKSKNTKPVQGGADDDK